METQTLHLSPLAGDTEPMKAVNGKECGYRAGIQMCGVPATRHSCEMCGVMLCEDHLHMYRANGEKSARCPKHKIGGE